MSKLSDPRDPVTGQFPFQWTHSKDTDIRKLFKRVRREELEAKRPPLPKVTPLRKEQS